MKKLLYPVCALSLSVSAALAAPAERNDGKNFYDVRFETLPENYETLLTGDPSSWDFNFRPYGRTSDLVSDPAIVRGAVEGKNVEGKHPTGVRVSCNAHGWSYLVFCGEPEADKLLAEGKDLPLPNLEMYFLPGDTDNRDIPLYYQFYKGGLTFDQYDWPSEDRRWRFLKPYVRQGEHRVANGYVFRLDVSWEGLWDRLPIFSDRNDSLWRLQVIRWADGGMTWGGEVHNPIRAGYIRWPAFTDAQKTAIMKGVLEKAWSSFKNLSRKPSYNTTGKLCDWGQAYPRGEAYAVAQLAEEGPRSYQLYTEDPAFRPTLERIVDAANALGAGIAEFASKTMDEKKAFYKEASERLFNFRYDVEEAYQKHLKEKLFK